MGRKAEIKGSHKGQFISPDHDFQDTYRFLDCERESGAVIHCDQGQKDRAAKEQRQIQGAKQDHVPQSVEVQNQNS